MTSTKQLFLFRHAKSAWPEGVGDHERPLAPRGIKAASKMASLMARERFIPDLALVSTARRTQETWNLMAPELPQSEMRSESRIYEAHATDLLRVVQEADNDIRTLMLVGHNPGLEILALQLMRATTSKDEARLKSKFPTAALAVLSVETGTWSDLGSDMAVLERFITPKMLK